MTPRDWRALLLPCEVEDGAWLSGFVDGEGCFSISRTNKGGYRCEFILKLRADDRRVLEELREIFGIGAVVQGVHTTPGVDGKPWAAWRISKKTELIRLTEILDYFGLRSKKARDYEIWRKAVIHWANSDRPIDWWPLELAYMQLRSVREYAEVIA